jgi:hypothetical protein
VEQPTTLDALIDDRAARLVEYQDEAYAQRYRRTLERLREVDPRAAQEDSASPWRRERCTS